MDKLSRQVLNMIKIYGYTEDDFDTDQLTELYLGLKNGLSESQVAAYITPALTADQMIICRRYGKMGLNQSQIWEIRFGFLQRLTKDQVKLYADPNYNTDQMQEIRWGLQNGLTNTQIQLYAGPKYNWMQMRKIRIGLEGGLSIEQLKEKYTFFHPEENTAKQAEPEIEI